MSHLCNLIPYSGWVVYLWKVVVLSTINPDEILFRKRTASAGTVRARSSCFARSGQRARPGLVGLTVGLVAQLSCLACSSQGEEGAGGPQGGGYTGGTSNVSSIGGSDGAEPSGVAGFGSGGGTSSTGGAGSMMGSQALVARTWRLTHEQYEKSIFELLGVSPDRDNFSPESGNGKFSNFSSTSFVQVDLAANYYRSAKNLALTLPTDTLRGLTSCKLEVGCKEEFIREFGSRAFRSEVPLEAAERLGAVFDLAEAEDGAEFGYRAVVIAILNSPLFLYRKEIGPSEGAGTQEFELTGSQVAEFLSYSLLDSPPPAWLRSQASQLSVDPNALDAAILKLTEEPAFEAQLHRFLAEWLEVVHFDSVEKSEVYPGFEEVKPLFEDEVSEFFSQSAGLEQGLSDLLLDPVPVVAQELSEFYYSDPSAPSEGVREGVLGLGAVLASHAKSYLTSPTLRGTFVRARFFCMDITLPEGFDPPPLSETEDQGVARSTRELYERHQKEPACATCHDLTDSIGFTLESFDGVGRFRTRDITQGDDVPIDTTGELTNSDVDRPLSGPRDLSVALSESSQVKECFARQAFRFYFGQLESGSDLPAVEAAKNQLVESDKVGALLYGLLSTDNTIHRIRGEEK